MLEVLDVGFWAFGGGTHPAHLCEGQISKCRWFGIVFYVRENLDGGWSFYISSNERMSDKRSNRGTGRPSLRRNVLDLCTLHASDWDTAADVVRSLRFVNHNGEISWCVVLSSSKDRPASSTRSTSAATR